MSGFSHAVVIVAVIALIAVRQLSAQRITDERRWWILPGLLLFISVRAADAPDPHHGSLSAILLGAGLLVGLVTGAGWGWTARLWCEADGSAWSRGTTATAFIWTAGLALCVLLAAAGLLLGIHQGMAPVMMTLALMLLARGGVLTWRSRGVQGAPGIATGAGSVLRPAWKDHV